MHVRPYASSDEAAWDAWCSASCNGTLLHTRRFLSYHGDRFTDQSLLIMDGTAVAAVLPAASDPADRATVVSHPGSTYGGLVHDGRLTGDRMVEAFEAARRHYETLGFDRLVYKVVPSIYHRFPAADDLYALFRVAARRSRCDLSATIDLANPGPISSRRKRALKKARQAGIEVAVDGAALPEFWAVLNENLASKHGARPVHDLREITLLHDRFPEHICLVCARHQGAVVAGILLLRSPMVDHAQYIAASAAGRELSALDAVFDVAIAKAAADGSRYFDFGISTEDRGRVLNAGLNQFKREFGAGGVVYEHYEWQWVGT